MFLLIPVMLTLLFLLGFAIIMLGGFIAEYIERRRKRPIFQKYLERMLHLKTSEISWCKRENLYGLINIFKKRLPLKIKNPKTIEKIIDDIEIYSLGKITNLMIGARLGPALGLMGTLIPLGPGLMALGTGNISILANSLVVAFTTTIIGLFTGSLFYIIAQIKRRWYLNDLNDLRFIQECVEYAHETKTET